MSMSAMLTQPQFHQEIDRDLLNDTLDWFSGKRSGHMSKWLYSSAKYEGDKANGAAIWAEVVKGSKAGSPYYVYRDENEAIAHAVNELSSLISVPTTLVDLGPGSREALEGKIFPLIKASRNYIAEYVGVDISRGILSMAEQAIDQSFKGLPANTLYGDFFSEKLSYTNAPNSILTLFYGLTMFNLAIDPRVEGLPELLLGSYLKRLKAHFGSHAGYLVISQDANQDPESLIAAYQEASQYYPPLLHRIIRDLPIKGDFDPDVFDLCIDYTPATKMVGMAFVPSKEMKFEIGGKEIALVPEEKLYFATAFKPDIQTVQDLAVVAGFEVEKTIQNDSNCVLHILKHY